MAPFKELHPFGTSTKRFKNIGYHPDLDPTGSYRKTSSPSPSPCHYKVKDLDCIFKKKRNKENWTRKLELEEYSKSLGYKNASLVQKRHEDTKKRGPGWYNYEAAYKPCEHNIFVNFSFGMTKRFKGPIKNDNPPPGTYGVPYTKIDMKNKPKHQWTPVPTFEWDGFVDRFRKNYRPYELPPNIYNVKDFGGIDYVLKKVVSKRGPYDLFTGPRDNSTIKGYFTPAEYGSNQPWPQTIPSSMDRLLKHKSKARTGMFFKAKRWPSAIDTRVNAPSETFNLVSSVTPMKQNMYPFNCSVVNVRPSMRQGFQPGPGRYRNFTPKCTMSKKETWQFKSKTRRPEHTATKYNAY